MATVGINFGSATSGAGFDVATTVSSILAVQRTPETAWTSRTTQLKAQDAALTSIGTALSALTTSLSTLTSFDGALSAKSGASSDPTTVALTAAGSSARAGTHAITVQRLAQTSSQYSSTVASGDTLAGSLTLQVGGGAPATIALDSSNNTLAGLSAAINAANLGVNANVITDTSGSRLSLVSATSGAAGGIAVTSSVTSLVASNTASTPLNFTVGQNGLDAQFTVDGVALTNSSNSVSNAIPGVTVQLLGTSSVGAQVEIANDTSTVTSAVKSFVTSYNALVTAVKGQEGKDSTGAALPLYGSSVLSQIQAQTSSALGTASVSSGALKYLTQFGVTAGTDGTLSVNATALAGTLSANFDNAASFFQGVGGFGQSLLTSLNGLGGSGTSGAVQSALAQNASEETTLATNTSTLEARLATYQTNLTATLNTANQILQGIPQQLNEINQIYAAITGYGNNKGG